MRILLLALVLSGGCTRELSEVTTRKAEPAYLGDLSGLYELSLLLHGDEIGEVAEVPYGSRLQMLHIRAVDDSSDGFLLGIEEQPYYDNPLLDLDAEPYERLFFDAALDADQFFFGDSNRGPVTGKRVAGGGMVTLSEIGSVCSTGPRYDLVGRLVCPVNPALSGVYGGAVNACDSGEFLDDRFLALAFIDDSFVGHYPNSETLLEGFYNRYMEFGQGFSYGTEWGSGIVSGSDLQFHLTETDGFLHLSGDIFAFACTNDGNCTNSCENLELDRLAGGTSNECLANDVDPAIADVYWERVADDTLFPGFARVLFIHSEVEQLSSVDLLADGILRRADDPGVAFRGYPPDPCTEGCFCDLECEPCGCDMEPGYCDIGCDCDTECGCPCNASVGTCDLDCVCDPDCWGTSCSCNTDGDCTAGCYCDFDCFDPCPCERTPFTLAFPLPDTMVPVEYELFLTLFDPFVGAQIPAAAQCLVDDGDTDVPFDPGPPGG